MPSQSPLLLKSSEEKGFKESEGWIIYFFEGRGELMFKEREGAGGWKGQEGSYKWCENVKASLERTEKPRKKY